MTAPEKRKTPRVGVNAHAHIQVLGESADANSAPVEVTIVDASHRGMRLQTAEPLKPGAAVKIEIADAMFLGELCYCTPRKGGGYFVGVVTEQCLTGLSSLEHLIQALTPETERSRQKT